MNAVQLKEAYQIQVKIDELSRQRDQLLNGKNGAVPVRTRTGRKPMSAEAREAIRQAQLKRWSNMPKSQRAKISREARKRAKADLR